MQHLFSNLCLALLLPLTMQLKVVCNFFYLSWIFASFSHWHESLCSLHFYRLYLLSINCFCWMGKQTNSHSQTKHHAVLLSPLTSGSTTSLPKTNSYRDCAKSLRASSSLWLSSGEHWYRGCLECLYFHSSLINLTALSGWSEMGSHQQEIWWPWLPGGYLVRLPLWCATLFAMTEKKKQH